MKKIKKIIFNPKVTLGELAQSIKYSIRNAPQDIIKNKHESLIDEEFNDLYDRKIIKFVLIIVALISIICLLSSYVFLRNTSLSSLTNFFAGVTLLTLVSIITARLTLSFKTIRKYERLLSHLKWSKSLFNENSTSIEKIENQIDEFVFKIDKGLEIDKREFELFDTRTIVILIDIFNNINDVPRFNEIYYANIVRKITGCSPRRFRNFIKDPYSETYSIDRCIDLVKKLEEIKIVLNEIEYNKADDYIIGKIKFLDEQIQKIKMKKKPNSTKK